MKRFLLSVFLIMTLRLRGARELFVIVPLPDDLPPPPSFNNTGNKKHE